MPVVAMAKSLVVEDFIPPQPSQIQVITSKTVLPVSIYFFNPTDDTKIVGEIGGIPDDLRSSIDHLYFSVVSDTGAVFSEFPLSMPIFEKSGRIAFSFSTKDKLIPVDSKLVVRVENDRGEVVGENSRQIPRQKGAIKGVVSDLEIQNEKDQTTANFSFSNKIQEVLTVIPTLTILDREQVETMGEVIGGPIQIEAQSEKTGVIVLTKPLLPQVYEGQLSFETTDGKAIGGVLRKHFLVAGNFVVINDFSLKTKLPATDHITLSFAGVAQEASNLIASVTVDQKFENKVVSHEVRDIEISALAQRPFSQSLDMPLEKKADRFESTLIFKEGSKILGEKHLSVSLRVAPSLVKQAVVPYKTDQSHKKWWGLLILLILLCLLEGYLFFAKKNKRKERKKLPKKSIKPKESKLKKPKK